jgi:anhydro-N-acetylmuramic acid kinase
MYVIGLLSGTSIDAIDAVLVDITVEHDSYVLVQRGFVMQPFAESVRARIRRLMPPHQGSTAEVCEVHALLGEAFADAARAVAERSGIPLEAVDLIASHGQTVYHQIAPGATRSTLQLAAPAMIAERTGCTVVANFRQRDMAAGGEGAPLAPYLDVLLFADNHLCRAVQNIGGIGNVTYLPAAGASMAFDTGPGNVLIDEAVRLLTNGRQSYDRDGRMAAAGTVDEALLDRWLRHPFFAARPPKSTGREQWGPSEAWNYLVEAQAQDLSPEDTIATLTALTARSIADAYRRFLGRVDEALIGGGGARNPTLMQMLRQALPETRVRPMDDLGLSADAKEAVVFALMGYATLHGWPSNVPAATGARRAVVLGELTPGANYRALLATVSHAPANAPTRARIVVED